MAWSWDGRTSSEGIEMGLNPKREGPPEKGC